MPDEILKRHLALAMRHVERGERLVQEQHQRVEYLEKNGHDTTSSKRFLNLLIQTLVLMREHLAHLEREHAG
jgi:hypothetical protein